MFELLEILKESLNVKEGFQSLSLFFKTSFWSCFHEEQSRKTVDFEFSAWRGLQMAVVLLEIVIAPMTLSFKNSFWSCFHAQLYIRIKQTSKVPKEGRLLIFLLWRGLEMAVVLLEMLMSFGNFCTLSRVFCCFLSFRSMFYSGRICVFNVILGHPYSSYWCTFVALMRRSR